MSYDDPAAAPLIAGLEQEYRELYGAAAAGEMRGFDAIEFAPPEGAFLVLIEDGETVAGGALRRLADGIGEVKRMWTAPAHRGRGYGWRILGALEAAAARAGYAVLRLETGVHQIAAIGLYRTAGYEPIVPYGPYRDDPRVRCFEKALAAA